MASAKPINARTSISLTWWSGKPPATVKEDVRVHGRVQGGPRHAVAEQRQRRRFPHAVETEILRLQKVIETRFGTPISEAALREAIVLKIASAGRWPTFIVSGNSIRRRSAAATS